MADRQRLALRHVARATQAFARDLGLEPLTTPVCSPQSNGMAESLVRTIKRDYVAFMPKPEPATAMRNLALAFEHYNEHHPHSALKSRSPREFRPSTGIVKLSVSQCPRMRGTLQAPI